MTSESLHTVVEPAHLLPEASSQRCVSPSPTYSWERTLAACTLELKSEKTKAGQMKVGEKPSTLASTVKRNKQQGKSDATGMTKRRESISQSIAPMAMAAAPTDHASMTINTAQNADSALSDANSMPTNHPEHPLKLTVAATIREAESTRTEPVEAVTDGTAFPHGTRSLQADEAIARVISLYEEDKKSTAEQRAKEQSESAAALAEMESRLSQRYAEWHLERDGLLVAAGERDECQKVLKQEMSKLKHDSQVEIEKLKLTSSNSASHEVDAERRKYKELNAKHSLTQAELIGVQHIFRSELCRLEEQLDQTVEVIDAKSDDLKLCHIARLEEREVANARLAQTVYQLGRVTSAAQNDGCVGRPRSLDLWAMPCPVLCQWVRPAPVLFLGYALPHLVPSALANPEVGESGLALAATTSLVSPQ